MRWKSLQLAEVITPDTRRRWADEIRRRANKACEIGQRLSKATPFQGYLGSAERKRRVLSPRHCCRATQNPNRRPVHYSTYFVDWNDLTQEAEAARGRAIARLEQIRFALATVSEGLATRES